MIGRRAAALLRGYVRLLGTNKLHVGVAERRIRALLLTVPYFATAWLLGLRSARRGALTVDATTVDGLRLRCRLPDLIQTYLYLFGTWEPDLTAYLRRRLRPGDTFIDIGANVGCLTALAADLVGPHGRVLAIEPSPPAIDALRENLAINRAANVRVVEAAVSDRDDELPLFAGPSTNTGLTTTVGRAGLHERGRVPAAPLGSLASATELAGARVVKIDVEGAEDRVLAGVLGSVPALPADAELLVELSPAWWSDPDLRPIDVVGPYLEHGFEVYVLPNDYWPWRYLWPADVSPPRRLRDLSVLHRRVDRLDIVLSRIDADAL